MYLSLQLALGEGHHLLVGHLREQRGILVQAQALQPGRHIWGAKGARDGARRGMKGMRSSSRRCGERQRDRRREQEGGKGG